MRAGCAWRGVAAALGAAAALTGVIFLVFSGLFRVLWFIFLFRFTYSFRFGLEWLSIPFRIIKMMISINVIINCEEIFPFKKSCTSAYNLLKLSH